jgi:hypothetical protein
VNLFRFIPGYEGVIFDEGKEPVFLLVLAFLIAFACTRGYTRRARDRGWGSGSVHSVHLHHVVVGIVFVLVAGSRRVYAAWHGGSSPRRLRDRFRGRRGLRLDEFALIFYLRDVYWSEEGRDSVDATILGAMIVGLTLVVSEPFGLTTRLRRT